MSQHFAEDHSIAAHSKGDVIRKGRGTGLISVGEKRQSRLELISYGTQSYWTGDTGRFSVRWLIT